MLLVWSYRYKNSKVVITIWLTVTKYPYLKWQWIVSFMRWFFFLSSTTDKTFIELYYIHAYNGGCLIRSRNFLPFASTMLHFYLVFCLALSMSYLCHLYSFAHSGVQHVFNMWITWYYGCFISSRNCFPIASPWIYPLVFGGFHEAHLFQFSVLCGIFWLVCLRPMSYVSVDCPFLSVPSVFSKVYLLLIFSVVRPFSICSKFTL